MKLSLEAEYNYVKLKFELSGKGKQKGSVSRSIICTLFGIIPLKEHSI